MTISWFDLDEEQQKAIQQLREYGAFRLKAISSITGLIEPDILQYFEDAAILPAAGNIGLVRKVGHEEGANSNCRIEVMAAAADSMDKLDVGSTSLVLKLSATKDIEVGEELRLKLPDRSSWHSKMNLVQHLALTGQPIPNHLVDAYDPNMIPGPPNDVEEEL
jgi:hypothetical protein